MYDEKRPLASGFYRYPGNSPLITGSSSALPPPMKKSKQEFRPSDLSMVVLLPWVLFLLIAGLVTFASPELRFTCSFLAVILTSLAIFYAVNGSAGRRAGAARAAALALCLAAACAAVLVGHLCRVKFMNDYWRLVGGATYRDVSPAAPVPQHSDATVLEFTRGSFVDTQRSLGLLDEGATYCVAPVAAGARPSDPFYWAVGENCCSPRGSFRCGDAADAAARSGFVVADVAGHYHTAIRMAGAAYDLKPASDSWMTLVWTSDPGAHQRGLWMHTLQLVGMASLGILAAAMLAGHFLWRKLLAE